MSHVLMSIGVDFPQKGCGDEISSQIHARGVARGSSSSIGRSDCSSVGPRRKKTHKGMALFLLLPRLLLFRPPRGGLIPRKRLEERWRRRGENHVARSHRS